MNTVRFLISSVAIIVMLATSTMVAFAGPAEAYKQALTLAAQGYHSEALASLAAAAETLPAEQPWHARMMAAHTLIQLKQQPQRDIAIADNNPYLALSQRYMSRNSSPAAASIWPAALAATLMPGAGHALQGRWSDAKTAALMVWPFLILTLWAARRKMGPVTLFFALITVWFWSGTVFSAISLVERGSGELYTLWWQGVWQASGLPGRPW